MLEDTRNGSMSYVQPSTLMKFMNSVMIHHLPSKQEMYWTENCIICITVQHRVSFRIEFNLEAKHVEWPNKYAFTRINYSFLSSLILKYWIVLKRIIFLFTYRDEDVMPQSVTSVKGFDFRQMQGSFSLSLLSLNVVIVWLIFLLRTTEVSSSNVGLQTGYRNCGFNGFPQSLHENTGVVP
jgi:hypothetical protein